LACHGWDGAISSWEVAPSFLLRGEVAEILVGGFIIARSAFERTVTMRDCRPFALALVAFASLAVAQEDDAPFEGRRDVSADGTHYVSVAKGGSFVYARVTPGSEPVGALPELGEDVALVRSSDTILGRGKLELEPHELAVSSRGLGFAMVGPATRDPRDDFVHVFDRAGSLARRFAFADVFAVDSKAHGQPWLVAAWIDDEARSFVLLDSTDALVSIELETGARTKGSPALLAEALRHGPLEARLRIAETLASRPNENLHPELRTLLGDRTQPSALRLRLATALRALGDSAGRDVVVAAATDPKDAARAYAIGSLPAFIGTEALPILRDAMRGKAAGETWGMAQQAFMKLGEESVPTLLTMLAEKRETPDYRGGAADALGGIKSSKALPALLEAVADTDEYVANSAVNAAIATGGAPLEPALAKLLEAGTTQDGRIAMHFEDHPTPRAAKALFAALERAVKGGTGDDDFTARHAESALEKLAGRTFGRDMAAWRKWVDSQR
jgi:HEAT repeat protein